MLAFWLLILVGIVLLIRRMWEQSGRWQGSGLSESAQEILRKRYARGEINKEQFEQMKADVR
jgi:putative membrane protein